MMNDQAASPQAPEIPGQCQKCGAAVPRAAIGKTAGRPSHTVVDHNKPLTCGPVFTAWRYFVAYVITGEGRVQFASMSMELPLPLADPKGLEPLIAKNLHTQPVEGVALVGRPVPVVTVLNVMPLGAS